MDHSAYDAYAFLVEAKGKKVFYSGDFRSHGRKGKLFEKLLQNPPKDVDVLLMEGTTLSRSGLENKYPSEDEIETLFVNHFKEARGLTLIWTAGQNIDRLVSIYKACRKAGKKFIADLYTASILMAIKNHKLPQPGFKDFHVFVPKFQRILVKAMNGKVKYTSGFANARVLPDNSWVLFQGNYLDSLSRNDYMAKMPPLPPADSVARGTLEAVTVAMKPPTGLGVNNAIIQFGYQEYTRAGVPYCTTRLDGCFANAATIPTAAAPFLFGSESPAGLACASGCTIAIPAVSQRALYYQVLYRNAANAVLASTTWQIITP